MALYKELCGHPLEWNVRVVFNGRKYSYCLGCIFERCGLDNLEVYDNPFIKLKDQQKTDTAPAKKSKPKKEISTEKLVAESGE